MANKIIPAIQTNEGNVGIGTTNPAEKLEVSGYILNRSKFGYTQRNDIVKNGLSFYVDFNNKTCFDPIISTSSIKDISNNNYALTLVNAATVSNKDGNTALYTANNSSYLQIASYVMALPHTWEAWVNGDAFGTGGSGWDTIWDSGGLGIERPLIGAINGVLNVYPNTNNCGTLTAGKWYHIVVTTDASSNIVTYINGVQTASFAYVGVFYVGTGAIWLGGDNSAETFNGYIPIARTYNRVLSATEVMQNYNAEKWRFDNASTFYHNVADGKVGIGTVSPASILNTVGAGDQVIRFAHSDNVAGRTVTLRLTNNNSTYADAGVYIQAIEGAGIDSYAMAFGTTTATATTSTTKMLLDNAGKLGIGTTNPIASLEVDNTAANLPVLNLGGGEAGNAVSDLYVLNSYNNNTGVGYAAKVIGVNISSSLTNQNIPLQRTTWGGVTSATAIVLGTDGPRAGTQDNAFQIWTTNDGIAGTSLTQKFSLTSAGDVGIGTVAPAQKLDVNGAVVLGINNSYGAYTRTPGGVLKPWFATAGPNTFFYNTNLSGSMFWQNAADTASLMSLTEQGRLGVNTNDPSGRLHVLDTVLYPPSLTWNSTAAAIIRSENGQIAFGSDDTTPYGIWQQVRTSSSTARPLLLNPLGGNVGIGLRNPTKKLHVVGSLYWDYNGTSAEEHSVAIQRTVAFANGSYTEIGTLAASANSIRATFEIFHHDNATIEYSLFELIANYYTGTTTDWVQLPSRTQAHYAGVPNGVVVDARLQSTGGVVELRLRSIGGAAGNMNVNVRIKSNTNLTESSGTGTGATVAGLLGFNRYEFPITNNRFKATYDGLFINANGCIGIGSTNPQSKLTISGTNSTIGLSFENTVANNPLFLSTYSGWAGIGMDSATAGIRLVGDYSNAANPLVDIGYYLGGSVAHANWVSRLKTFNNGKVSVGGMAAANTLSLLSVGGAGSTSAASGLTFGEDAQANLYRAAEDTIKTDGSLNVAGLIYNSNSAYYSSLSKSTTANWGQYTVVLGNASYSANIIHVSVNGGNIVWAGTFLASCHLSYRPNETWINVKLLECATYNCSNDDVNLLALSNSTTSQYGVPALVLKTNGAINGGYGTGYANNIVVTVNGPSPNEFVLSSSSWAQPYTYQIATSANTKQIYVNESGNVGIGTAFPTNQANYKFLQVNGTNSAVIETMVGGTRIGGFDSTASALYVGTIGNFPVIFRTQVDEKMRITAGGNVGIGSTNPSSKLTIVQNSSNNALLLNSDSSSIYSTLEFAITGIQRGQLFADSSDDSLYIRTNLSSPLKFGTNNSQRMTIDSAGKVGIGTTTPSGRLNVISIGSLGFTPTTTGPIGGSVNTRVHIQGNEPGLMLSSDINSGTLVQSNTQAYQLGLQIGAYTTNDIRNQIYFGNAPLTFVYSANQGVAVSERMRIDTAGRVGISTATPSSLLDVGGTVRFDSLGASETRSVVNQAGQRIFMPSGGAKFLGNSSTGAIRIKSPVNGSTDSMHTIKGTVFEYSTGKTFQFVVSFYYYNNQALQTTAQIIGGSNASLNRNFTVRVGRDTNGAFLIYIGELADTWNYSYVYITEVFFGWSMAQANLDAYQTGWVISTEASAFENVMATIADTQITNWSRNGSSTYYNLGKVGIGTNNPTTLLSVGPPGSTVAASGITLGGDSVANLYRISASRIKTDGSLTIDGGGGNAQALVVNRSSTSSENGISFSTAGSTDWYYFVDNATTNLQIQRSTEIDSAPRVRFNGANSDILFNLGGGNIGVGTSLPSGKLHVVSTISNDTVLRADGTNGTLFSVVDDLSDSLMSVNNSAGLPVLEVFADDRVVMGQYGSGDLTVRNNKVGIGTTNPTNKLSVIGNASIGSSTYNTAAPTNGLIVEGNVGIGSTSPTAKLEVYSTSTTLANFNGNQASQLVYFGSTAATSYTDLVIKSNDGQAEFFRAGNGYSSWGGASALNIYNSNGPIAFHANNTANSMFLTSAGNLGIGASNPAQRLDVRGYVVSDLNSNAVAGGFFVGNASHGIRRDAGSNDVRLHTNGGDLIFGAAGSGSQQVTLKNGGNVGIGSINPSYKLEVYSAAKTSEFVGLSISNFNNYDGTAASLVTSQLRFAILESPTDTYNASQRTFATCQAGNEANNSSSDGFFAISTRSSAVVSEKFRINSVGNVGIGLTNPSYRLQVSGGDVNIASANILRFGTVSVLNTSSNANDIYANIRVIRNESTVNTDGMYINYNSNGTTAAHLRFFANATNERMRIDASNGYVGVGTTVPDVKFDVYDNINGGNISAIRNASSGSNAYSALVFRRDTNLNGLVMFTNSSLRTSDGGLGNSTIRTDNGKLLLGAGASTYHSLETNGNVGIGLTNPSAARLHIKGNTTDPVLRVETALLEAGTTTSSKTFVAWLPIMTGAAVGDKVFIPLFK